MIIKQVDIKDKNAFNNLALHPLQSWQWGEFRQNTGIEVIRLGGYEKNQLIETAQVTLHQIPFTSYRIGYFPKDGIPSREMLSKLVEIGKQRKCIFIKLEPNILKEKSSRFPACAGRSVLGSKFLVYSSPHPLFTKYTFQLDLQKTDEELLKNMHSKTRYNIRVAQKHNVKVKEDNSPRAFETYLTLTEETTKRQKFYAHSLNYHKLMWQTLNPAGIAHLLTATYNYNGHDNTLVTWILFLFNNILYYPYGASETKFRNVMASNLMMWEAIRFGKKHGAKIFDMWGSLGPNPSSSEQWFGFHRFKEGFGAKLIEFVGSFDLVINPTLYKFYNFTHLLRNSYLQIKSYFPIS